MHCILLLPHLAQQTQIAPNSLVQRRVLLINGFRDIDRSGKSVGSSYGGIDWRLLLLETGTWLLYDDLLLPDLCDLKGALGCVSKEGF